MTQIGHTGVSGGASGALRMFTQVSKSEPWRLMDAGGVAVEGVAIWLADLQAAGRSGSTLRSYGLDLLRWFRFLWAVGVSWERATRAEARDFCRWLALAPKPAHAHWRRRDEPGAG